MAMYVSLLQFSEQGVRNVKDTINRAAAATAEAEKMGVKVTDAFWTMGAYDVVLLLDAPNDETITSFALKLGSQGKRQNPNPARIPKRRDGKNSGQTQVAVVAALSPFAWQRDADNPVCRDWAC